MQFFESGLHFAAGHDSAKAPGRLLCRKIRSKWNGSACLKLANSLLPVEFNDGQARIDCCLLAWIRSASFPRHPAQD